MSFNFGRTLPNNILFLPPSKRREICAITLPFARYKLREIYDYVYSEKQRSIIRKYHATKTLIISFITRPKKIKEKKRNKRKIKKTKKKKAQCQTHHQRTSPFSFPSIFPWVVAGCSYESSKNSFTITIKEK